MDIFAILAAALVMSALGLIFGALLGVTGRVFAVPTDPKVAALRECLPGANCGACGFKACGDKPKNVPCFFNANDLGIAIGSAASLAADFRIDSRVMFSVGQAVLALNLLPECSMVLALPLSVSGKSVFFDRK